MPRTPDSREHSAIELLLDDADRAFEREEFEKALELSERALVQAPRAAAPLHFRAAALARLGQTERAEAAFREALSAAPDDLAILKGYAELLVGELGEEREALEDALLLLERGLKLARTQDQPDWRVEFGVLGAMALTRLGEPGRALTLLTETRQLAPKDPEVALEQAIALFELCRFKEARRELERTLRLEPDEGWAHYYLGLLDEREGEKADARRHFADARKRNPHDFPPPVELSAQAFDQALTDALEKLPERVRRYLENVSIVVQDLPRTEDLLAEVPPLSPAILGLFHGTPITEQSSSDPWSHFPSSIALFQKNLQRFARSREELIEQIGITLIHEVGHFLGLSEEDLYERGLD